MTRKVEAYRSISWDCGDENRQVQQGMRGKKGISTATLAADLPVYHLLTGDIVMKDTEKTKGFSTSPVSAFLGKSVLRPPRFLHHSSSMVPSAPEMKRSLI